VGEARRELVVGRDLGPVATVEQPTDQAGRGARDPMDPAAGDVEDQPLVAETAQPEPRAEAPPMTLHPNPCPASGGAGGRPPGLAPSRRRYSPSDRPTISFMISLVPP
jgi:hypothetical protein